MVDNSWIKSVQSPDGSHQSKAMRRKVIITVALLVAGALVTVAMNGVGSNATQYRSEGILVDFGDYLTLWTDANLSEEDDPVQLLDTVKAKATDGFEYTMSDGKLTSVTYSGNTYDNSDASSWDLWYVSDGEFDAQRAASYDISVSDYTVVIWAYTTSDGEPMPAVDATATSIYGYAEPKRIVSLSPVCTETLNSVGGIQKVVGTDSYSNYPEYIEQGHKDGKVAIVGTYTDPSYEAIMNVSPDLVLCDASTYNDVQIAGILRSSNVNSVVLYNGEDLDTVIKNIFIVGNSVSYGLGAQAYIQKYVYAIAQIQATLSQTGMRTMIALSNDPSPWVSGSHTYANDVLDQLQAVNVFAKTPGWFNTTAEKVLDSNPECIIIIDSSRYHKDEYDSMLKILSHEWKSTDAYKNGKIYLLCDSLGDLGSRAGPRTVQLMEIVSMIVDPSSHTEKPLPLAVGDDYLDYLDITKNMGDRDEPQPSDIGGHRRGPHVRCAHGAGLLGGRCE